MGSGLDDPSNKEKIETKRRNGGNQRGRDAKRRYQAHGGRLNVPAQTCGLHRHRKEHAGLIDRALEGHFFGAQSRGRIKRVGTYERVPGSSEPIERGMSGHG